MYWIIHTQALKAKKPVLCEKPIASNEEEAKAMVAATKENHILLVLFVCCVLSDFEVEASFIVLGIRGRKV